MMLTVFMRAALCAATDISGKWEVEANFDDPSIGAGGFDCVVRQEAERLTGMCSDVPRRSLERSTGKRSPGESATVRSLQ